MGIIKLTEKGVEIRRSSIN